MAAKKVMNTWYLMKTRDPVSWMRQEDQIALFASPTDRYHKLIIQNPIPYEDGYYGGINEAGVAFISTFVRTSEDQVSYIRKPYIRLILEAATAREAVEIIKDFNPKIGGNMLVADPKNCYGIEATAREYVVEKIVDEAVKANHFNMLPDKNLGFATNPEFEMWSKTHEKRAKELVGQVGSLEDAEALLSDRVNSDKKRAICTIPEEDEHYTHSAFVFDTRSKLVRYAQGCPAIVVFREYSFEKLPGQNTTEQID